MLMLPVSFILSIFHTIITPHNSGFWTTVFQKSIIIYLIFSVIFLPLLYINYKTHMEEGQTRKKKRKIEWEKISSKSKK